MDDARLLERFFRYIACDSESGNERRFCEMIERELTALGLTVTRDEAGEKCGSNGFNIFAALPGEGEPLLLSAHLDTVTPGVGISPVIDNGVIRSSGDTILASDDKSGVAAVMEALEIVKEQALKHRPVEVLFSICEELGLLGSKYADYSYIQSKNALVLDSSMRGHIINEAPANVHLHIEIYGKSAHAGVSPEKGIHALKAAAHAISNIPCGHVDAASVMNIANFTSPGKTNIVPEKAVFDMEIRSFSEALLQKHIADTEAAVASACDLFGASYILTQERHSDVLYVPEDCDFMRELIQAYKALDVDVKIDRTYGGSDATWLFANGINALNIGTGMQDVHSLNEYISIADLQLTARLVLGMIVKI